MGNKIKNHKNLLMYQHLFTIAAIFAVNASAVDHGSCDDPDYSCTLYNDEDWS